MTEPSTTGPKQRVWKLKTSSKIKHFLWQALTGYLATASKLVERHCGTDTTCQRCGANADTINHLLYECPPALQCWALSTIPSSLGFSRAHPCSQTSTTFSSRSQEEGITHLEQICFHGCYGIFGRQETRSVLTQKTSQLSIPYSSLVRKQKHGNWGN